MNNPFLFPSRTLLRNNLRDLFQSLRSTQHPPRRRFLTLSDPRILSRATHLHPHHPQPLRSLRLHPKHHPRSTTRLNSNNARPSPDPTPHLSSPNPESSIPDAQLTLSQRFRKLSREYGWSAVGIYFLLSALDFPFCFVAVRLLGTERIGHWEHVIVTYGWRVLTLDGRVTYGLEKEGGEGQGIGPGRGMMQVGKEGRPEVRGETVDKGPLTAVASQGGEVIEQAREGQGWNWGVEEAEVASRKSDATIWTQLALAYAIHKSFIFLRIPATVAVTPKVVKVLRGWGIDIGKRKPKVPSAKSKGGASDVD